MGAWGVGPYDNDHAADMLGDLSSTIDPWIEKNLKSEDLYEVRAAAWVLGQLAASVYTYSPIWDDETEAALLDDEAAKAATGQQFDMPRDFRLRQAIKRLTEILEQEMDPDWRVAIEWDIAFLTAVMKDEFAAPGLMVKLAEAVSAGIPGLVNQRPMQEG